MPTRFGLNQQVNKPSRQIINEAAEWLMKMQDCPLSGTDEVIFLRWRAQSDQHEQAWEMAQGLMGMMDSVPSTLGQKIWGRNRIGRRAALKTLASLLVLVPVGKITWDQWSNWFADFHTAAGEQKEIILLDGSFVTLNTSSSLNVRFSSTHRLIELVKGEILIETNQEFSRRDSQPFIVETNAGTVRALGTRFNVRDLGENDIKVDVYEHAVAIKPSLAERETQLTKGQTTHFSMSSIARPKKLKEGEPSWKQGQIIADNQKLGDLVAELSRYRSGFLRCDEAVAGLPISGVFQLNNTDVALDVIESTLPVQVNRVGSLLVLVTAK